jgi:hypothetical protein
MMPTKMVSSIPRKSKPPAMLARNSHLQAWDPARMAEAQAGNAAPAVQAALLQRLQRLQPHRLSKKSPNFRIPPAAD